MNQTSKKAVQLQPTKYAKAHAEIQALRDMGGFDDIRFLKWDSHSFVKRHGISDQDLSQILSDTRPRLSADRFEWLQAVTQCHHFGVRALRIANALFLSIGSHGYCWPSQTRLAKSAGYSDPAEVRRGLTALVAYGVLRKLKIHALPEELAEIALRPRQERGSGRSLRGIAYVIVPRNEWLDIAQTGTPCPSNNRDTESLLNYKYNPKSLRDDISSSFGDSSYTLQNVDTSTNGHDVSELSVYEEVPQHG